MSRRPVRGLPDGRFASWYASAGCGKRYLTKTPSPGFDGIIMLSGLVMARAMSTIFRLRVRG
jgi:hypothetical protein